MGRLLCVPRSRRSAALMSSSACQGCVSSCVRSPRACHTPCFHGSPSGSPTAGCAQGPLQLFFSFRLPLFDVRPRSGHQTSGQEKRAQDPPPLQVHILYSGCRRRCASNSCRFLLSHCRSILTFTNYCTRHLRQGLPDLAEVGAALSQGISWSSEYGPINLFHLPHKDTDSLSSCVPEHWHGNQNGETIFYCNHT